jgi:hypothetical protein
MSATDPTGSANAAELNRKIDPMTENNNAKMKRQNLGLCPNPAGSKLPAPFYKFFFSPFGEKEKFIKGVKGLAPCGVWGRAPRFCLFISLCFLINLHRRDLC